MFNIRKPIVAGQFYSASREELTKEVSKYIKKKENKNIISAIVPHAGYFFSGKCAGKLYSLLPAAETYVLAGVNHSGSGEDIAISTENFETPLGVIKNDAELADEILRQLSINADNQAHKYEHSVEVQLPFLQLSQENFKIVPIILKTHNLQELKQFAKAIQNSANKLKRKVICIASSDFTHTGPAYSFSGEAEKIDKKAISEILKFNSQKFLEEAEKTTICGAGAIATIIEFSKLAGAKKAELLEYYTSSAIMPSENAVGYAAIAFY